MPALRAARRVLLGSISGVGGRYVIGLKAIDCTTGDCSGQRTSRGDSREQVLNALGKATRRMRAKSGRVAGLGAEVRHPGRTGDHALAGCAEGLQPGHEDSCNTQGYAAAVPYFKSAIDLDPNFAMAYARLGVEYFNLNQPTLAAEYATRAYQLRDHTSEREKLYITSHYHDLVSGDADQTIAAYQLLAAGLSARRRVVHEPEFAGTTPSASTTMRWRKPKRRCRLDPSQCHQLSQPGVTYIDLNRLDDAQKAGASQAHKLAEPALLADFYEMAFLRGDTAGMARQVSAATGQAWSRGPFALDSQSDTEAYFGRLTKARELSQAAQGFGCARRWRTRRLLCGNWLERCMRPNLAIAERARQDAARPLSCSPGKKVQHSGGAGPGQKRRSQTRGDAGR